MLKENIDETIGGIPDDKMNEYLQEGMRITLEMKKLKGVPIQKYDYEKNKPYLEYPDGSREYA